MTRSAGMSFGLVAAGVLVVGLWLPWASVTLLGVEATTANGQEIGSGILDYPVGWLAAACGVIAGIGAIVYERWLMLAGGVGALAVTGYTALAIPGTESNYTANGVDIGTAIQVEYAPGLFIVLAAAAAVTLAALFMGAGEQQSRQQSEEPEGSEDPSLGTP